MRKVLASSVMVLMVLFLSAGFGLAGNGQGSGTGGSGTGGGGACGGTGISLVCSGIPTPVVGTVSDESYLGSGLQIDTGAGTVAVYGIGPYRYWDALEIDRPAIGDVVTVDGMAVTFSDESTKIIAMSITFEDGTIVDLREACVDGVGGQPLWRGSRNSN